MTSGVTGGDKVPLTGTGHHTQSSKTVRVAIRKDKEAGEKPKDRLPGTKHYMQPSKTFLRAIERAGDAGKEAIENRQPLKQANLDKLSAGHTSPGDKRRARLSNLGHNLAIGGARVGGFFQSLGRSAVEGLKRRAEARENSILKMQIRDAYKSPIFTQRPVYMMSPLPPPFYIPLPVNQKITPEEAEVLINLIRRQTIGAKEETDPKAEVPGPAVAPITQNRDNPPGSEPLRQDSAMLEDGEPDTPRSDTSSDISFDTLSLSDAVVPHTPTTLSPQSSLRRRPSSSRPKTD